jgi:hypothetical protein
LLWLFCRWGSPEPISWDSFKCDPPVSGCLRDNVHHPAWCFTVGIESVFQRNSFNHHFVICIHECGD